MTKLATRYIIRDILDDDYLDYPELSRIDIINSLSTLIDDHQKELKTYSREYLVAAYIYLTSRCPANSDKPLTENELINKTQLHPPYFRKCRNVLRKLGATTCKVTVETILKNPVYQKELEALGLDYPKSVFTDIITEALKRNEENRLKLIGRNPFSIAAGLIYYEANHGRGLPITQVELSRIFNVTETTIRSVSLYVERNFKPKDIPKKHYINDKPFTFVPSEVPEQTFAQEIKGDTLLDNIMLAIPYEPEKVSAQSIHLKVADISKDSTRIYNLIQGLVQYDNVRKIIEPDSVYYQYIRKGVK